MACPEHSHITGGSKYYKNQANPRIHGTVGPAKEDTERNLQLAVKQNIDNMNTCVKQFDAARKGVEQAERGYLISQKRYDTGAEHYWK